MNRKVNVVRVDAKMYRRYQQLRAALSTHLKRINGVPPEGLIDYQEMIRLHLQLFYPGVVGDMRMSTFPASVRTITLEDSVYKEEEEGKRERERLEADGLREVRHPILGAY